MTSTILEYTCSVECSNDPELSCSGCLANSSHTKEDTQSCKCTSLAMYHSPHYNATNDPSESMSDANIHVVNDYTGVFLTLFI